MALPWVRLDSNIAIHDKVLSLLADPSPKRWQAATSYVFSLGWCGAAGTNGQVPPYALTTIQGTKETARLLEKHGLWDAGINGWQIRNYERYQQLSETTQLKQQAAHDAAVKANCVRWHGKDCGCWKTEAA